ncbi:MAG: GNAT family N-acetyltransferase, partial [Thermodesulfovibrionales bacterium]
ESKGFACEPINKTTIHIYLQDNMREYTGYLETQKKTIKGLNIILRPAHQGDDKALEDFFDSLSTDSILNRFTTSRVDITPEGIQKLILIDHSKEMVILALLKDKDMIVGMGQYFIDDRSNTAEVAFIVRDEFQNRGIARELIAHLMDIAKKRELRGFTAETFMENKKMIHLFESMGFTKEKSPGTRSYELRCLFNN